MTPNERRTPHSLLTLAGWVVFGALIATVVVGAGFCLAAVSDVVFGARP